MRKGILLLWAGILMITGCIPAVDEFKSTPTAASVSIRISSVVLTPTLTSTPQPPLVEHEWYPEPILVYYDDRPGMRGIYPSAPYFILYADGRLFITYSETPTEPRRREKIVMKQLDRQEVCQILNTQDQIGYLDYKPEDYYKDSLVYATTDAGDDIIQVRAWKTTLGQYYGLEDWLFLRSYFVEKNIGDINRDIPKIPPALFNTLYFLGNFPHSDFQVYNPEKLLLWVSSRPDMKNDKLGKQWPINIPALAQLHAQTGSRTYTPDNEDEYIVLEKENAQIIFELFDKSYDLDGDVVFENGIAYQVFVRPLLPYEEPHFLVSEFPTSTSPKPVSKLHCYPSDGTLTIPTPSYP